MQTGVIAHWPADQGFERNRDFSPTEELDALSVGGILTPLWGFRDASAGTARILKYCSRL
jgi:hypothetical protein